MGGAAHERRLQMLLQAEKDKCLRSRQDVAQLPQTAAKKSNTANSQTSLCLKSTKISGRATGASTKRRSLIRSKALLSTAKKKKAPKGVDNKGAAAASAAE